MKTAMMNAIRTTHTSEEREEVLKRMQQASDTFYQMAVRAGFHQFIEFSGFISEYIKSCRQAHLAGIDFLTESIPFKDYQLQYVAEKMDCIFGDALFDKSNMDTFIDTLKSCVQKG